MSYISASYVRDKDKVLVWERVGGQRVERWYDAPYYFYYDDPNGKYKTMFGTNVSKLQFRKGWDYVKAKQEFERSRLSSGIEIWESDISPDLRVLSSQYYNVPSPKLHVTFYDIEVDVDPQRGFASIEDPYAPIVSISAYNRWNNTLLLLVIPSTDRYKSEEELIKDMNKEEPIPDSYNLDVRLCDTEEELILQFIEFIDDSDLLCGYNSEMFDHPYLFKRIERLFGETAMKLMNFKHGPQPYFKDVEVYGQQKQKVQMSGRILADYMILIKKYEPGERSSYKLASVEEDYELNLPKLTYEGTLFDLYRNNLALFCRYNIRDCEILEGFEQKLSYVQIANDMYHMSTGLFDHVPGTLKLAELSIINECHHELKLVVPNNRMPEIDRAIQGAFVVDPVVGFHKYIFGIDLTSLYPSAIRSCNMSPETIVGYFKEEFDASEHILNRTPDEYLTFVYKDQNKKPETKLVVDWVKEFEQQLCAVSGYGVVFDLKKDGIIPNILTKWFESRKYHKRMQKSANTKLEQEHHDRLQYIFKIKLNSLYGALSNVMFRFYELLVAESTTAIGRMVSRHQRAQTNFEICGKYEDTGHAVVGGDTDSCYAKLPIDTEQEVDVDAAIALADDIAKRVNASFPDFMKKAFLCQGKYSTMMSSAREIVADTAIFVEKKRYMCHIIDLEGVRVDKFKVMGLDIKKTSLPKETSAEVEKHVQDLLRGKTWDEVALSIVKFKDKLKNAKTFDLGLPKGIKGVEKYTLEYKLNGDKTRIPGHVRAAIYYNQMLDQHKDKTSIPITSGMKIKVFYLKHPDGKFKSIALPTDIEVIPEWFNELECDIDAHIERLVDKPFGNIVKALGKKPPTYQTILIDELLEF